MKKVLSIILTTVLMLTALTACSTGEEKSKLDDGVKKVGYVLPTTNNPFLALLAEGVEKSFTDAGWEVTIGVADGDSSKQIEQIENMVTMNTDVLIVMAVDPTALSDTLASAKEAGVKIIDFTTATGQGDVFMGSDEGLIGSTVAQMASDWIDQVYADATEVQVVVMEFNGTPESVERSEGLQDIANNAKVNVVATVEVNNTRPDAQAAMENLMITNPEVDVVLTYNTGMALGVNDYAMSESSTIADLSKFAVFGSDNDPEVLAAITSSATNESVLRGATQLGEGLDAIFSMLLDFSEKFMAKEAVPAEDIAHVYPITAENASEFVH